MTAPFLEQVTGGPMPDRGDVPSPQLPLSTFSPPLLYAEVIDYAEAVIELDRLQARIDALKLRVRSIGPFRFIGPIGRAPAARPLPYAPEPDLLEQDTSTHD